MKKLTLATLSTLAFTLACTNVFAVDGTITVNGVIADGTCTLNGGGFAMGLKDISVDVGTIPKSKFTPTLPDPRKYAFTLYFTNAAGTGACDVATSKAFQGIHLSAISPDHLDATDKRLLVNKATGTGGASSKNPIFIQIHTKENRIVNFSAPWGVQAKSAIYTLGDETYLQYDVVPASKTGIVDAQNYAAKINYTIHYN
ncbi:putative thin pilus major protein AcuA [Acinetobacter guillouiae]|uniref:fimbrial protein n=1 Tax=Acinetobacter guillouiae TaxID=106649 RepID=UPI0004EF5D1A|nr:fimbrial protein [Acinetobacter guillouiae]BAP37914.1 putative thin pilus major protein AcuA [Acinetobacter guillouiae]